MFRFFALKPDRDIELTLRLNPKARTLDPAYLSTPSGETGNAVTVVLSCVTKKKIYFT